MSVEHVGESPRWFVRDELFKVFIKEIYGRRFGDRQIERIIQSKTIGPRLTTKEMFGQVAWIMVTGLTSKKIKNRKQNLLNKLDEHEQEVTNLSIGLNYCGTALNLHQVAQQLNMSSDQVDETINSALQKLSG